MPLLPDGIRYLAPLYIFPDDSKLADSLSRWHHRYGNDLAVHCIESNNGTIALLTSTHHPQELNTWDIIQQMIIYFENTFLGRKYDHYNSENQIYVLYVWFIQWLSTEHKDSHYSNKLESMKAT